MIILMKFWKIKKQFEKSNNNIPKSISLFTFNLFNIQQAFLFFLLLIQ